MEILLSLFLSLSLSLSLSLFPMISRKERCFDFPLSHQIWESQGCQGGYFLFPLSFPPLVSKQGEEVLNGILFLLSR